ncbi:hypothetical protein AN958_07982 [Leucoagaricus sp. SymC.cos]|nr:hypothetical protein AN958_07982 [Leucoagaricus sp. SymC.cos]
MFSSFLACFVLIFSSSVAPPPSPSSLDVPSSSLSALPHSSSSSNHTAGIGFGPHHPSKPSNSSQHHTRPPPIPGPYGYLPPRPSPDIPSPTVSPDFQPHHEDRHRHPTQRPIAIVFEVLGGLIGLAALTSCLRCCYIYNKTPKRDRIEAILDRHQLERELAELGRSPRALRRSPTSDPLPLYFPPPPTYETVVPRNPTSAPAPVERSGYTEVATRSPPSSCSTSPSTSPSLPTRQLESDSIPRRDIPLAPNR